MADSRGFANQRENDSRWQTGAFAMGQAIAVQTDYTATEVRLLAKPGEGRRAGAPVAGDRRRARWELADGGGDERGHGSPDAAGLGDPFQRAGAGWSGQHSFAQCSPQAQ